ncbi:carbohydrate ABC transporter permease [Lichenibacterium ramalinae]|uniref:Sugar ABC transporter permease n=1 Tax=Lichenibacterium ramalinae TaxID=2316527 RepID=A0A4V1RII5_9HYPH|nr:sugar ABC transporter permease [Lichenibacterium ramalinae]RYB04072.1 sugar ABC transporter permease [Lichenibacterium ramalinae]
MSVTSLPTAAVAASRPKGRRRRRRDLVGLLYVLPAMALVLVFFIVPIGMTAWMSLHNWPLLGLPRFIGLRNYERLWSDAGFWASLRFTLVYTGVATVAIFAVAFPLALLVEKPRPLASLLRTAFFLPVVVGFATAALLWVWLLNTDSGLFSPALQALGITPQRINILGTFDTAFAAIVAMVVWKVAGFTMILLMTGLQGIPADIVEAARIDHAGPLQRFRFITLPLMRRTLGLALILCITGSMLAFDQFYIMVAGGPGNQTLTAVYWIFNQSFVSFRLGYGAALSIVLLAILLVLSLGQLWLLRDREDAR